MLRNSILTSKFFEVKLQKCKKNLRGDYKLCEGYTVEYVSEKPDERRKYRNPECVEVNLIFKLHFIGLLLTCGFIEIIHDKITHIVDKCLDETSCL